MHMKALSAMVVTVALASAGCASLQGGESGTAGTANPTATAPTEPVQVGGSQQGVIPVGQELDVRLGERLSSGTATAEQRFQATTVVDLRQGEKVLVPGGSTVRGFVSAVESAGRLDRKGSLTLAFDQIVVGGREYPSAGWPPRCSRAAASATKSGRWARGAQWAPSSAGSWAA